MSGNYSRRNKRAIALILSLLLVGLVGTPWAIEVDFTGSDRIDDQVWRLTMDFRVYEYGSLDSFWVRLPYPAYEMRGRWATYTTRAIEKYSYGDCGPTEYEIYIYNQGYSNEGLWMKVRYPCATQTVEYAVQQDASLNLPGIDYPLQHFTNNGWMSGSYIVDVEAPIVASSLAEALAMSCDWHTLGYWPEPEQIVNWMKTNLAWFEPDSNNYFYPLPASIVLSPSQRGGECMEWAHAACALFLKAGIPAKVVLSGPVPQPPSAVGITFDSPDLHLSVAYWDGYGWILIDPLNGPGFGIINRVILGADRDLEGVKIISDPPQLMMDHFSYTIIAQPGYETSYLYNGYPQRCTSKPFTLIDHYEIAQGQAPQGTEPVNNVVPVEVTAVGEGDYPEEIEPRNDILFRVAPNPCNPVTFFEFFLRREGRASLKIYSTQGRFVDVVLDNKVLPPGPQRIEWAPMGLATGVYFVRLIVPSGRCVRKIVILR